MPVTGQSGIPLQAGCKYQQQDVVFVRGLFPVLGPYKHTAIYHPSASGWPSHSLFLLPALSRSFSSLSLSLFLSPHSMSGTSQLSSMTLSNQTDSSGLMRLLGVAFPGEKDKQEWEKEQEEARRRDHRRIGTVSRKCK